MTRPAPGASGSRVLRRVHLPLMRRGLLTALILVFVEVMKEMPATLLLRPLVSIPWPWRCGNAPLKPWQEAAMPAPSHRGSWYPACPADHTAERQEVKPIIKGCANKTPSYSLIMIMRIVIKND